MIRIVITATGCAAAPSLFFGIRGERENGPLRLHRKIALGVELHRLRPYGALIAAAGSWGVATAVAKYAVDGIGAFTTLFIEVGTAAAALWIAMLRMRPRRTVPLRHCLFLGLLEPVVAYGALDLGLQRTGAADAALLDGLQSAMVLVMGVVFIKEAVTRRSVAGVLVATVGAALLTGAHFTLSGSIGDALVLLGAMGASVIVVSRLAAEASALEGRRIRASVDVHEKRQHQWLRSLDVPAGDNALSASAGPRDHPVHGEACRESQF
ncbi:MULTISPECIES: DMT family transporter [Streptomyces]|uniref:DMT family transporter n=1 Tax=Streptomyces TaxID=1883 RepID=UPI00341E7C26